MNQIQNHGENRSGRPAILPVFLPHSGCKERCLFCNQKATGGKTVAPSSLPRSIESFLAELSPERRLGEKQVAFYGGTFTAMGQEEQLQYLRAVRPFLASQQIDSIRISTRPDAISAESIETLKAFGVQTVELGAQTMNDEILSLCQRGHSAEDTDSAVVRLRRAGLHVGLHLMIGLPGDTLDRFLRSLEQVIALRPNFVRIHPTLVLRGAPLEASWGNGNYGPLSLDEAIAWLKKGVLRLERAGIAVARLGLQPTEELNRHILAGPYHPALRQLVDSSIMLAMARALLVDGMDDGVVSFICHPREVSNLRGQGNRNVQELKKCFGLCEIGIVGQEAVPPGRIALRTRSGERSIQRKDLPV